MGYVTIGYTLVIYIYFYFELPLRFFGRIESMERKGEGILASKLLDIYITLNKAKWMILKKFFWKYYHEIYTRQPFRISK